MILDTGMVIVYEEEWAGFYNNGILETSGDSYLVEEYVFALMGVRQVHSDNLIDPNTRDVRKTVGEINESTDS